MKSLILTLAMLVVFGGFSHSQVLDPNDPVITYDPQTPPATPPYGTLVKWVRTKRVNWNTDDFKCYFYKGMPFRLRFPKNYDASGNTKYPLVLMLPGRGEKGEIYDNENNLKHAARDHNNAINDGAYDGFLLFPQSTNGYWGDGYLAIINELILNYLPNVNVDLDRILIHGLSSGGAGVWNFISQYPRTIAAALPMSASSTLFYNGINNYKHITIWLSQGGKDTSPTPFTSKNLVDEIVERGGNIRYTLYHNLGHGVWNTHYGENDFWPFINRAHKTVPVILKGELTLVSTSSSRDVYEFLTQEELCPGENVQVRLGLTGGFEAYQWRKDGVIISGATSNEYVATEYGVYDARFKRNGVWSQWSERAIEVKEKSGTITPDIQVSGLASKIIPSPDGKTSVPLELPEGYVEYGWKLKNTSTILSTERVFSASLPGEYVATVTEQFGCSSSFSSPFKVVDANDVNPPPALSSAAGFALSKTSIKLQWAEVPNAPYPATAFEVYRSTESGTSYELISIVDAGNNEYIDNNLLANTFFYYIIRPVNQNAAAPISDEISVKTDVDGSPPSTPLNIRVTQTSSTQISLAWDPSTDDVGVHRYDVYKDGVKTVVAQNTSATVFNLQEGNIYRFQVKARDLTGNESPFSTLIVALAASSGLSYKYYHGSFSTLPDFNTLSPVTEGTTANFDIGLRTQNNNFAFYFEGEINIPVAGNYTFETRSDDGSKLYIGGYDENLLVVNNDGLHGMQYRSGTYNFPQAGKYPIVVTFFEQGGGEGLEVFWKNTAHGVGNRQRIPDSAFESAFEIPDDLPTPPTSLTATAVSYDQIDISWQDKSNDETGFQIFRADNTAGPFYPIEIVGANTTNYSDTELQGSTTYYYKVSALGEYGDSGFSDEISSGLTYEYYETGSLSVLPDFSALTPKTIGQIDNFDISVKERNDNFAFRFFGKIGINTNGEYTFYTKSDDGSKLFINGTEVVWNDKLQGPTERSGKITLAPGSHDIEVQFFERGGGEFLEVRYAGPGIQKQLIPTSALRDPEVNATTLPLPDAPDAPPNVVANALSVSEIQLSWNKVEDADGYTIYRSIDNDQNFLPIEDVPQGAGASIVYNDNELNVHTNYFYQIEAYNVGGESSSGTISVSTLNTTPVLDEIGDQTVRHSVEHDIQIYGEDADGDVLTITGSNLPSFATLTDYGDGSGLLRFNSLETDQGIYSAIEIMISDGFGGEVTETFTLTVNSNFVPGLSPIADISLSEGALQTINLQATDQEGTSNLIWETENFPSFGSFTSSPDGTAEMVFTPSFADGGIYENVTVRVTDQSGSSAEKDFTITVSEVNPNMSVLVNFRQNSNASSPWNNIGGLGVHTLQNTAGEASGVSLELLTSSWKTYTQGAQTGNNTGVFPDAVLKDYYYFGIFGALETVTMKLSGLSPATEYNFSFLSSSVWNGTADNGTTVYTIGTESSSVYAQGNTQNTADFEGIVPNAQGEILVTMSKGANTPVGYINGFKLESVYGTDEVPAPPRSLTASLEGSSMRLNWVDAPYNEDGFRVYRSQTLGGPYTQINTAALPSSTETYLDETISEGEDYYYTVTAYNVNGESPYSNEVEVTVPNTPPSIVTIGSEVIYANQVSNIDITVTDPPLNEVSLSVTGLPTFASYAETPEGGQITLNPTQEDIGSYPILIEAQDGQRASSNETLTITVEEELLYSVSLNFSNTSNAGSPWNNTSKNPSINDVFGNLKDQDGNNSGVSVTLLTNFGGVFDEGATTGNDSGVVPDKVLEEYYWFGFFGAPNEARMKVSGLDNMSKHTFRFVGSSLFSGSGITDNGETDYLIGNKTVSLDVQGNTQNAVEITDVIADANGEVLITIRKGNGASVGYINALIIESYAGDEEIFTPSDLHAVGLSKNSITLSWTDNSLDELGFEVYRSSNGRNGNFSLIHTTNSNVSSYNDTGLQQGAIYHYKVRAKFAEDNFSDYTETVGAGTIAYYVYVNINGDPTYNQGVPWNNLGRNGFAGDIFSGFKNDQGNTIGIAMEIVTGMQGSNDWGTSTGNNSGVFPDNVMKSFYFNDQLDPKGEFRLLGMDLSFNYNLKFFGAIETSFNIVTNFTAGGETVSNNQTNNISEVAGIYGLNPTDDGEIIFKVQEAAGSRWAIFNAFVIEAYPKESEVLARKNMNRLSKSIQGTYEVSYGNYSFGHEGDMKISYYPNPVGEVLHIRLNEATVSEGKISIFDLTGVEVMKPIFIEKGSVEVRLREELIGLSSSMYIVVIELNENKYFHKIMKQ